MKNKLLSLLDASKKFGIPTSTLRDRMRRKKLKAKKVKKTITVWMVAESDVKKSATK